MAYLLDSNIFIQAKNEYYGFDLCPGFWNWLEQQNQKGEVFSIDRVQIELSSFSDDLSQWVTDKGSSFFLPLDQPAIRTMTTVSTWVQSAPHKEDAKRVFLSGADPFLIAYAKAHSHTVVSHEIYVEGERRKVKIPAVCRELNIPCIRTFEMLRQEGVMFVLP
ncbi:MAG: DUF4411 family protein [Oculatellaceae cyanobacterium bins.114]|nr:DUF4411 family protein [Oculatellaceae cyanobacterium bins.114]